MWYPWQRHASEYACGYSDLRGLERAGFVNRGGKGSHRNFVHERCRRPVTISGGLGEDAKQYQIRSVRMAIRQE